MGLMTSRLPLAALLLSIASTVWAGPALVVHPLLDVAELEPTGVILAAGSFGGRRAIALTMENDAAGGDKATLAVVPGTDFHDGTIEVDIASEINPDSSPFVQRIARGFAGIAFRIDPELKSFESIYLRPANGRADDEVRRAHAVQYFSYPDYDFRRFRKEAPGLYEAPADIGLHEWNHVKVVIEGQRAQLFINGSDQAVLVVNDLKLGPGARGQVGLFIDAGSRAWFSNLRVTAAD